MRVGTIEPREGGSSAEMVRGSRLRTDGELVVVDSKGSKVGIVGDSRFPSLLRAIEQWEVAGPVLEEARTRLESGDLEQILDVSEVRFLSPLPRTYALMDGSAYIQHIILVRKARNAEPPETLYTVPLMYQGLSDEILAPTEDIPLGDDSWGLDYEAEVAVILDDVPQGTKAEDAEQYIKLIMLMNDVSLRGLIPGELKTGFGFFHGKPASAFSPFAVTPDELGDAWKDGRVHLDMCSTLNGEFSGNPNAGAMHFSFYQLIEHAAKTRNLTAGTILGSGTVSNEDESRGVSCLAERRMLEKIKTGEMTTPFMKDGDRIEIEMFKDGRSVFGKIDQKVVAKG